MTEQKPVSENSSPNPPPAPEGKRAGWRRGPMQGLFWGMLLILLGTLFFVQSQGGIAEDSWWQYFLIGLGAIFIIDALIHQARKIAYGVTGRLIAGGVLIVIGLSFVNGWDNWWPIVLIVAGVAILAGYLFRGLR